MINIPILMNNKPRQVLGYVTLSDESFIQMLKDATPNIRPIFELGWGVQLPSKNILHLSVNPIPAYPIPAYPSMKDPLNDPIKRIVKRIRDIEERDGAVLDSEIVEILSEELSYVPQDKPTL